MPTTSYAIALGSNRRHGRHGPPEEVLIAALEVLRGEGLAVALTSPVLRTPALGPAGRAFANAAAVVHTARSPFELLQVLKRVERQFGRRRGRRWGPRVLDLDIILWSGGTSKIGRALQVPHAQFRSRSFVLDPLVHVAPGWRDPRSGHTVRQLRARLRRPRPVDRAPLAQ